MGLNTFSWLGRNNEAASSADAVADTVPTAPETRYVDTPREEWVDSPLLELLPEDRQRYWQQRRFDKCAGRTYSTTRLNNTSTSVVEAEVYARTMGRLAAALDKLEQKL